MDLKKHSYFGPLIEEAEEEARREGEAEGRVKGEAEGRMKGEAEGRMKGEAEGRLKGEAQGEVKGAAVMLERQLERRFGPLPAWTIDRLHNAGRTALESWALRLLDAATLDEVFR